MNFQKLEKFYLCRAGVMLAAIFLATALAVAGQDERTVFVLTSTNSASGNAVVVFQLDTAGTPSLSLADTLPTGGKGGASTNAGILQFKDDLGAVANYGSNSVSQLVRSDNFIGIGRTINLAPDCVKPGFCRVDQGTSLRGRHELCRESCVALRRCGWNRCQSLRSFGCADSGRQELGSCHVDLGIRPSTPAHAG